MPATAPLRWPRASPRVRGPGRKPRREAGFEASEPAVPPVREPAQEPLQPTWAVPSHVAPSRAKAFVDFQNDVTAKDLGLAVREGFQSIEHVKRYTTAGHGYRPGQDQQRQCAGDRGRQARHPDRGGWHHHLPHALYAGQRLAHSPARTAASCSTRSGARLATSGPPRRVRCSRMSATGSARAISRMPARTCMPRSSANAWRCGRVSACSTPARWARSTCRAGTARNSSTASTPTPGPSSRSVAAATA